MSKSFNPIQEGKTEGDIAKRILRGINDIVRALDDVRGHAQLVRDLFLPSAQVQRSKLHELSYRLILIDPQGSGKRGEETLWKKGYHDVFITARRLKKNDSWDEEEAALARGLLLSGMGHYQHLIFRLQSDYSLRIDENIDLAMSLADYGLAKGKSSHGRQEEAAWADALAGRCLVYMGDLARYMKELEPGWDLGIAERLYIQSSWLDLKQGRPFNQLGTLAGNKNYSLDAVYFYIRSLSSPEPFDAAGANLLRCMEKNAKSVQLDSYGSSTSSPVEKLITHILVTVDNCYQNKTVDNLLVLPEILELFQNVISGSPVPAQSTPLEDVPFPAPKDPTHRLPRNCLLKIFAIFFMCWEKANGSSHKSMVAANILSLLGVVLEHEVKLCGNLKSNRKKRRAGRRRYRRESGDSSESEASIADTDEEAGSGDSPEISSDEDENETAANGHVNGVNGYAGSIAHSSDWAKSDGLSAIYLCCAWLKYQNNSLLACGVKTRSVLNHLIIILNELNRFVIGHPKHPHLIDSKLPTIEDREFRGLPGLSQHHSDLEWPVGSRSLVEEEQVYLRSYRLLQLGKTYPGLGFGETSNKYYVVETVDPITPTNNEECRGKLMKNMGQLWLKAEVKELENRIKKAPGGFTPYLVVDKEALVEHIALIKQLVGSRKFIVVIPTIVLTQLDESKRESVRVRETIRWLESQFQHGNRHLRAQKAQEKHPLGLIKYPKKKDKDAWEFFQMIECCSYFGKQSELRSKSSGSVTLLTGCKDICTDSGAAANAGDFSPFGLASSVGVALEYIESFHSKWKASSKSHG